MYACVHRQTALFLVTHPSSVNFANSIKCVGDYCFYRIAGRIVARGTKFWQISKKVALANIILAVQHLRLTYYASYRKSRLLGACAYSSCNKKLCA